MEVLNGPDDPLESYYLCLGRACHVYAKNSHDELQRLQVLLNKTREEIARDHITRAEVRQDLANIS